MSEGLEYLWRDSSDEPRLEHGRVYLSMQGPNVSMWKYTNRLLWLTPGGFDNQGEWERVDNNDHAKRLYPACLRCKRVCIGSGWPACPKHGDELWW